MQKFNFNSIMTSALLIRMTLLTVFINVNTHLFSQMTLCFKSLQFFNIQPRPHICLTLTECLNITMKNIQLLNLDIVLQEQIIV